MNLILYAKTFDTVDLGTNPSFIFSFMLQRGAQFSGLIVLSL